MNQNDSLENGLQALGASLRARPRLADRVMDELRASAGKGRAEGRVEERLDERPPPWPRGPLHRRPFVAAAAGIVAMVGVGLSVALLLVPEPSVGWADVTQAIQSQKWIRGKVEHADGKRGSVWLSPERQVWAFTLDDSHYFFDGREKARHEYHGAGAAIVKLPLGEDEAQRVLPIDALSADQSAIGPWLFGTEKVVQQQRRTVTEDGKSWIEFQMVLGRGEMNRATLRVDPDTRLPVYLRAASPKDQARSATWWFDYPQDGPADIYALGVPRDTEIDDRMPSDESLQVLAAMADSRARIGDFRLIVGNAPLGLIGSTACYPGSVVYRKANHWRVDHCLPQLGLGPMAEAPKDRNWGEWFEEQLKINKPLPLLVCDGKSVWMNSNLKPDADPQWQASPHTAPQDLMSGEGLGSLPAGRYVKFASLLFPDLSLKPGWEFEFDGAPADAPGCVLIKRSAHLASKEPLVGHEWYYIDPAKGHAVVRIELFNLPPAAPVDPSASKFRQTLRMEDFQQAPGGFWYAAVVRDIQPAAPGSDGQTESTVRYHFDFQSDLSDSLFTVEAPPKP